MDTAVASLTLEQHRETVGPSSTPGLRACTSPGEANFSSQLSQEARHDFEHLAALRRQHILASGAASCVRIAVAP